MKKQVLAWIFVGFGLFGATLAQASPYAGLVIFGDSLSDSGNNALLVGTDASQVIADDSYFARIPFASGRYTNGPVWAERLATMLGLPLAPSLLGGSNYAFGGAETGIDGTDGPGGFPFSMRTQLGMYLADSGGAASAGSLYIVAGGGNNVRVALEAIQGGADPFLTIAATAAAYAQDIGDIIDTLQGIGAEHILVWNTPNYGLTPAALFAGPMGSFLGTAMSQAMNDALALRLAGEPADLMRFDFFNFVNNSVANAASLGLSNVSHACGDPTAGCDPDTALFYDGIHPTAFGHQLLAAAVADIVVPEPSSLALLGLALLVLVGQRRAARAQPGV